MNRRHGVRHLRASAATSTVNRLGFGAMQLTGQGVWGQPKDRDEALARAAARRRARRQLHRHRRLLRPDVTEELIREALHPYADDLVIATKAGLTRQGPATGPRSGGPSTCASRPSSRLRRLGVERIDLFQLHRIDPRVPLEDQVGELAAAAATRARSATSACPRSRSSSCEARAVHRPDRLGAEPLQPRRPRLARSCSTTATGRASRSSRGSRSRPASCRGREAAERRRRRTTTPRRRRSRSPGCCSRSPVIVPIPGTSSVAHLEENVAAADLTLSDDEMEQLGRL